MPSPESLGPQRRSAPARIDWDPLLREMRIHEIGADRRAVFPDMTIAFMKEGEEHKETLRRATRRARLLVLIFAAASALAAFLGVFLSLLIVHPSVQVVYQPVTPPPITAPPSPVHIP